MFMCTKVHVMDKDFKIIKEDVLPDVPEIMANVLCSIYGRKLFSNIFYASDITDIELKKEVKKLGFKGLWTAFVKLGDVRRHMQQYVNSSFVEPLWEFPEDLVAVFDFIPDKDLPSLGCETTYGWCEQWYARMGQDTFTPQDVCTLSVFGYEKAFAFYTTQAAYQFIELVCNAGLSVPFCGPFCVPYSKLRPECKDMLELDVRTLADQAIEWAEQNMR